MKNIAIFSSTMNPGGIERSILRLLRYAENRANYTVIVRSGKSGDLYDEYKKLNIKIIFQSVGYFNVFKLIKVYRLLKKNKFDTVCDYSANFSGTTMWLAKLAGVKNRVAFYRSSSNHYKASLFKNLYNRFSNRLVFNNATSILSNSQSALTFFFPYVNTKSDDRFEVVYNGIEMKEFGIGTDKEQVRKELGIPLDAMVVGHTGRYSWPKNFPVLVEMAKCLCDRCENLYFVFCGQDTNSLLIKDYPELSGYPRIITLGYREDVPRVLSAFDIFVFPSLTEGQPNSLLEAVISGLPIIASNIAPIKECIPDELYGQLVDCRDVNGFIEKVLELINNEEKRKELDYSNWARKKYDSNYLFEKILKRFEI